MTTNEISDLGDCVQKARSTRHRYAKDLLHENEKLLSLAISLNAEKVAEKALLEEQVTLLREELNQRMEVHASLAEQLSRLEEPERVFAARCTEAEQTSACLASLYVASDRIHGSVEREDVIGAIREIVINLIGSEDFALFERDDEGDGLTLTASVGIDPVWARHSRVIDEVLATGTIHTALEPEAAAPGDPEVCIPLRVGDRIVGVIAIYGLLAHKDRLETVDYELFNLLMAHAGIALYAANLHARHGRKGATR